MTILLAVVAGGGLGLVLERGDFCFHSTWRRLLGSPREASLLRAYLLMLVISTPIVQILIATGVIEPFVPPLAWQALIPGGLLFGVGMVIASTCISGMFYKLGNGMLGMVVAISAWAAGDLLVYRGPLKGLRDRLNESPVSVTTDSGESEIATVTSALGGFGVVLLVGAGLAIVAYLVKSHAAASGFQTRERRWGWLPLGIATALVMSGAWLLVRWHGFVYSYGTSGVPSQLWDRIVHGNPTELWIPIGLICVIPGAFVAARLSGTLWVRGEQAGRYGELAIGGFTMGIGAAIAGGCNLGHSMVGVPLLSLGSILATLAIIAGVVIADRVSRSLR